MQVFNNEKQWNNDKCRCECKELLDKGICDKGFIWSPSNCECTTNIKRVPLVLLILISVLKQ